MACLLYTQLFLLNTFILFLNLSLNPVLGQILAGIEKSIIEEEGALEALNFAVSEYNENNSDLYLSRVVEVKTVKTVQQQIEAGKTLLFDVILGKTACLKTQDDLSDCPLNEPTDLQEREFCSFEVHLPDWANAINLLSSICNRI
ncbi:rCG27497 [Rattus norvegicus]|uniref:RCG27497 n=2 Tax=Rattus norvegicus TaxID=10116 RepID=A6K7F5_RAT|nr:rCG27497 [Rattus norvegicus]